MTSRLGGRPATTISLAPSVRGENDVQSALEAGVQILLLEQSFLATIAAPPGEVYASDTRFYEAGIYELRGSTTVTASAQNTEVELTYRVDGVIQPIQWVNTPSSSGSIFATPSAPVFLIEGDHTFEVLLSRASGAGSAEAQASVLWLERFAALPPGPPP